MRKEPCAKFYGVLIGSRKLWSYKVLNPALPTPYPRMYKTFQPWFSFPIFVNFMEKGLPTHSYGRFDHLSWRLNCLDVRDIIQANEHTLYANCGLHVKFWKFCLKSFCFMMRKSHFKLIWLHEYKLDIFQQRFNCSNSTTETLEKGLKYVQN